MATALHADVSSVPLMLAPSRMLPYNMPWYCTQILAVHVSSRLSIVARMDWQ